MDIGQLFIEHQLATRQQVEEARQHGSGERIDRQLISMGVLTEEQVLRTFADDLGMQFVSVKDAEIDPELLLAVVRAAEAPVICETADPGRRDDIAFLRGNL